MHSRKNDSAFGAAHSETESAVVPDEIEVQEYGSANPTELARWLSPSRTVIPAPDPEPDLTTPKKRRVNIDSARVIQIQRALASRGFYSGEMTGVYDEATVGSMRRFQSTNKISVTGYPTAQALKRLGLTNY